MREREFWELLEEVFGRSYGRSLARDQRMPQLANMTVLEALDAGEEPRVIWTCSAIRWRFLIPSVGAMTITRRRCPLRSGLYAVALGGRFHWLGRGAILAGVSLRNFEQMFACVAIVIHSDG